MEARRLDEAFSMAAFLAFLELRSYCEKYPSLTEAQALVSLSSVKSSSLGLDFRGGLVLRQALDPSVDWNSTPNCLRLFAFEWIRIVEPRWLRFVPFGRERVRRALDSDHAQCFREAGLFDETPNDEAIEWWDRVAALIRGLSDIEKMKRARLAERLSFEHERRRIKDLGICQQPKWVSLEDNSLGYDILSYDRNAEGRIVARLVEVKSKLSDSIFLTRNEWESAFGAAQRTVIHVWDLPMERLQEYHPKEIEASIPLDQGGGVWQNVRINVSSGL